MSKNPAIGSSYLSNRSVVDWHRRNLACFYPEGNLKKRLPRYLKDKIFDDAMKLEIREHIINKKHDNKAMGQLARDSGYRDRFHYFVDQQERFTRLFEKRMKKSRKDI